MVQITQANINRMETMLNNNDRTGMELYYYELTGSQAALNMAYISSFSSYMGGTAYNANMIAKASNKLLYPVDTLEMAGVEHFSVQIAVDFLSAVKREVAAGNSGDLTQAQILATGRATWDRFGLGEKFPGNAQSVIDAMWSGDVQGVFDNWDKGTFYGAAGGFYEVLVGQFSSDTPEGLVKDFDSDRYAIRTTADGQVSYIIDTQEGRTVHVFGLRDALNPFYVKTKEFSEFWHNLIAEDPVIVKNIFNENLSPSYAIKASSAFNNIFIDMGWVNPNGSVNLSGFLADNPSNSYLANRVIGSSYYLFGASDTISFGSGLQQDFSYGITGLTGNKFTGIVHQNVSNPSGGWLDTSEFDAIIGRLETLKYTNYQNQITEYDVRSTNVKEQIEKLGGSVWVNEVIPVHSDGDDYSLIKNGASTNIAGVSYLIGDVMDSLNTAATEIATFVSKQVDNATDWFKSSDGAQLAFAEWLGANMQDLVDGNLSAGEAFIGLAQFLGERYLTNQIINVVDAAGAKDVIESVLKSLGVDEKAIPGLSAGFETALARMAIDFALNSEGWDSEQYLKAGVSTISGVVAAHYAKQYFGVGATTNINATVAAVVTAINGLLNSSDFSAGDWLMLGAQVGIAAGAVVAGEAIASALITGATPGGPVAIVAAAVVALVAGKILGSLFGSAVYHEGEFGDTAVLLNSLYQVQQVSNGQGGTVEALVAVNANGSTIIAQGITTIFGNIGQDVLVGGASDDSIYGGSGSDYLEGRDGKDALIGADGDDHISGGNGDDYISGGLGDDVLFGDGGNDTIVSDDGDDFVHLGAGDDITATGNGRDIVMGAAGSDSIDSGAGDDVIDGGLGDDVIGSGDGKDLVFGNLGNDIISLGVGDDVAFGDAGNDQIYGDDGNDIIAGGGGVDILHGDNGSDIIDGGADDDLLEGGLGNDRLAGGDGDDVLLGGMDNDLLVGGAGNDTLKGEFGDDILINGAGSDTLEGGDGDDWYSFTNDPANINNFITDNQGANDSIVLSWLTEANINNLVLSRVGDNLDITVSGKNIVTVLDQFNGKAVESIEIAGGKTLNLTGLTGTGVLTTPTVNAAVGTSHQAVIDARIAAIDSEVATKEQYFDNAFTKIVADSSYQELLGDQIGNSFYNGNEIASFKRDRGKCGGAYTVYKLDQVGSLNGTDELLQMKELAGSYNAADYDKVSLNVQKVTSTYNVNYSTPFKTVAAIETVKDYYDAGNHVATVITITDAATSAVLSSTQIVTGDLILPDGTVVTESARLASGTTASVTLGLNILQTGADKLVGAWWDETLAGQSGPDVLVGNGGDDTLDGGAGNDWIFGGDGNDAAYGRVGDDIIFGGAGNDSLNGNEEEDAIIGGAGNDFIHGHAGSDWIEGGGGNDIAYGDDGDDVMFGGSGNDTLYGNAGNDNISGGDGNDSLVGSAGADVLDGGEGIDIVFYADSTAAINVNISLTTAQSGGDAQGDILSNIENITGTAFNDTLTGNEKNNRIIGMAGADIINGGAGIDTASYIASASGVNVNLNLTTAQTGGDAQGDVLSNIENITGSDYNDTLTGNANDNIMNGGAGADIINGGAGVDTAAYSNSNAAVNVNLTLATAQSGGHAQGDILSNIENILGSAYNDTLTGDSAANIIEGGLGADTINGGGGIDTLSYANSANGITVNLLLTTAQIGGGDGLGDIISNIESVSGSVFDDIITGDNGNNTLLGNAGDDLLYGGGGADNIDGGVGNDRLWGYAGHNILHGGLGNDILYGDLLNSPSYADVGNNQMFGDDGNDTFIAGAGPDAMDGGAGIDKVSFYLSNAGVTVNLLTNANSGGFAAGDSYVNIENIEGSTYDDVITGDAGNNHLFGDAGHDNINGGGGADSIDGGTGIDTVFYSYSTAGINVNLSSTGPQSGGDAQGDILVSIEVVTGSEHNDIISGNSGVNVLFGYEGDDTLSGGSGADTLNGGADIDTVSYASSTVAVNINLGITTAQLGGDAQGDTLFNIENLIGSSFDDNLTGDSNNNSITGGSGWDLIKGGAGADSIYGNDGNDTLYGGAGADTIDGGAGSDYVVYSTSGSAVTVNLLTNVNTGGEAQGDLISNVENIIGSDFNDNLTGNSSDNTFDGRAGADTINGGDGLDTVSYEYSSASVTVNLLTNVNTGGDAQGDVLSNVEYIIGSAFADTLIGDAGNNIISGLAGNDTLYGGAGADKLDGGTGTDTASYMDSNAAVNVNLGITTAQSGGYAAGDTLVSIENIIGSAYNDTLKGNSGNNIITGGVGADKIDGATGTDTVSYATSAAGVNVNLGITSAQSGGDAQGDTLISIENIIGTPLNDTFISSSVANKIDGGLGIDSVSYASSTAAVVVNLGVTTAQSGGYAAGDTLFSIENLIASNYNDTLTGSSGNNTITGGAGADKIDGGTGIDTVSYAGSNAAVNVNLAVTTAQVGGHAAGDTLFNIENIIGSSYSDTLKGTSIANIINGGLGNDKMTGGSGADIFKFSAVTDSGKAAGARDIITDFVKGTDKIDLADFSGTFAFKGTGALGGSVAGVNYAQASGNTIIGIDADGNGTLDMQIELTGLHTLAASDFLL